MNISEIAKKLTAERVASIAVIALGAAIAIVGASNDFVFQKLHISPNEYWRAALVLLGVVVTMVGASKFRKGANAGPSGDELVVDLNEMPTRKADTITVSYSKVDRRLASGCDIPRRPALAYRRTLMESRGSSRKMAGSGGISAGSGQAR